MGKKTERGCLRTIKGKGQRELSDPLTVAADHKSKNRFRRRIYRGVYFDFVREMKVEKIEGEVREVNAI